MLEKFFEFEKYGTDFKTEIVAGLTSFATMSYVMVLNPIILKDAGMPFDASLAVTILVSFLGCMLMGLFAKRPFGVAPYMADIAFITYTIIGVLGFTWQQALCAIFICGIVFLFLTLTNIRPWLVNSIPTSIKLSFTAGLGLFIMYLGLANVKLIEIAPDYVSIGNFRSPEVILALLGCVLIFILTSLRLRSAILISILVITFLSIITGIEKPPEHLISFSIPTISPIMGKLDFTGLMSFKGLSLITTIMMLFFVNTMGTILGVSYRAGLLDNKGNLPDIQKPMFADSLTTTISALLGGTTSGVYAESATGVEAGGRTGLTAVVTGFLFLFGLLFAPLFSIIPPCAYAPALIVVGMTMFSSIFAIDFRDWTEYFPSVFAIIIMAFSGNIGIAMALAFILYPLLKVVNRRVEETNVAIWVLCLASLVFVMMFPYK